MTTTTVCTILLICVVVFVACYLVAQCYANHLCFCVVVLLCFVPHTGAGDTYQAGRGLLGVPLHMLSQWMRWVLESCGLVHLGRNCYCPFLPEGTLPLSLTTKQTHNNTAHRIRTLDRYWSDIKSRPVPSP